MLNDNLSVHNVGPILGGIIAYNVFLVEINSAIIATFPSSPLVSLHIRLEHIWQDGGSRLRRIEVQIGSTPHLPNTPSVIKYRMF